MAKPEHDLRLSSLSFLINLPEALVKRDLWVHLIWMNFERFQMVPINSSGLSLRAPWWAYVKIKLASVGKVGLYVNFFFQKISIIIMMIFMIFIFMYCKYCWTSSPWNTSKTELAFKGAPYQYLLCLGMQFTFIWQQKSNSLCLQTLKMIVDSMFVFLGFAVLWAVLILSHSVYIYLSFSPKVRSLPPAETKLLNSP